MSDQERWQTPPEVWNPVHREFRFDLDAFADDVTKRLPNFISPQQDAMKPQEWPGKRIWMNPPYGRKLAPCMLRGFQEAAKGKLVVACIPLRGRGGWWHDYVLGWAKEILYVRKRVKFIRPDGTRGKFTGSCDTVMVVWDGAGPNATISRSFHQEFA